MKEENTKTIGKKLTQAIKSLLKNQPNLFELTSETGQTEWNLAHHVANEIGKFFPWLDYDLDVIKLNFGDKRPDIIFHKRGTHQYNLLVIEVKRNGNPKEIDSDKQKIEQYWFQPPLKYDFGAVINIGNNTLDPYILVFKNTG